MRTYRTGSDIPVLNFLLNIIYHLECVLWKQMNQSHPLEGRPLPASAWCIPAFQTWICGKETEHHKVATIIHHPAGKEQNAGKGRTQLQEERMEAEVS
jgi:hypothetical protein